MSVTVRNQIIQELFVSKEFNDCINKMEPEHLRDDLRAEVALILLEQDEQRLIKIHQSNPNGLKFFAVRVILNLIQSKTSPFYKKYRTHTYEFKDQINSEEQNEEEYERRLLSELREERVLKIIDGLYWYDKELVKLYIKLGNYRDIEKETGIKWQSCYDTIQTAIARIRYELRTNKN